MHDDQLSLDREEQISIGVRLAYVTHGYVDDGQEPLKDKVADALFGPVSQAVAEKKADREKVLVTRRRLVQLAFPDTPGPEMWGDQDDPDIAEAVWDKLWEATWDVCSASPKGLIQSRLNGDLGLVLVRLQPTRRGDDWGVYVTRDYKSLHDDVILPTKKKQEARARSDAAVAMMMMERIPEHAKKFQRELVSGLQTSANVAKELTKSALTSIEDGRNDDAGDDSGD
jgi:hypothetical protein